MWKGQAESQSKRRKTIIWGHLNGVFGRKNGKREPERKKTKSYLKGIKITDKSFNTLKPGTHHFIMHLPFLNNTK